MDGRTEFPAAVAVPPNCFVADARTARAATRALVRARGWRRLCTVILVPLAFVVAAGLEITRSSTNLGIRLLAAFVAALVVCLPIWICAFALAFAVNLRIMKRRFFNGAVWQTSFEPDAFVVCGPLQASRYSYDLVESVVVKGDFVVLRQRSNPLRFVYPRALIPDDALERLRHWERQHPGQTPARRRLATAALVLAVGLAAYLGATWTHREPPDYQSAAEIAVALHDHDINCAYEPIVPASRVRAASAGICTGDGYVVNIYVYATEADRFERLAELNSYWCRRGRRSGGWIAAHRWFLTVDRQSGGPTNADLRPITGGAFVPIECASHAQPV